MRVNDRANHLRTQGRDWLANPHNLPRRAQGYEDPLDIQESFASIGPPPASPMEGIQRNSFAVSTLDTLGGQATEFKAVHFLTLQPQGARSEGQNRDVLTLPSSCDILIV